jgi:hypothetical protein
MYDLEFLHIKARVSSRMSKSFLLPHEETNLRISVASHPFPTFFNFLRYWYSYSHRLHGLHGCSRWRAGGQSPQDGLCGVQAV